MPIAYDDQITLGHAIFAAADLGDQRRTRRLVQVFDQFCRHPGGSLPDKLQSPGDLKALYRLMDCDAVTHAALLVPLRQHTQRRIDDHEGPVLILHDATELDYTSHDSLADELGQIGQGPGRGYICQNVLAVDPQTGATLGLMDQILHCRDEVPEGETLTQSRDRDSRESLLWLKGTRHLPADRKLIDVCDQGADTFEFLEHECRSQRRFVIRSHHSRKVYAGHQPQGRQFNLKDYARRLPALGSREQPIQAQQGARPRKARRAAQLQVSAAPVLVLRPHSRCGRHGNDPLPLYVVRVWESNPPQGEKPIEWVLLTNEPVLTEEDAWRVVGWYQWRWVIEEFHKGLKTGCGIEELQFTDVDRLQPMIALLSAVATTLLNLRDAARHPEAATRRATTILAQEYVEVLSLSRYRKLRPHLTVAEFYRALARLGGHQNRKRDGFPGWLVLWRGWTKLQSMLEGYLAAKLKQCG